MIAILKRVGEGAETVECDGSIAELSELIGGAYEVIPALAGAMVLCRAVDMDLPENCHFLGRRYRGDILVVGRGEHDEPRDIPRHLVKIIPLALGGKNNG